MLPYSSKTCCLLKIEKHIVGTIDVDFGFPMQLGMTVGQIHIWARGDPVGQV